MLYTFSSEHMTLAVGRLFLCSLLFCLTACASQPPKLTALAAAYPGELAGIMAQFEADDLTRTEVVNGVEFHFGEVDGHPVVLFETGIGLTNAAMTTQLAFERFNIQRLFFAGVAGGLDPSLSKGDASIPARWHFYEYGARFTRDEHAQSGYRIPEFMQERISTLHLDNFFPYPMRVRRAGATAVETPFFYAADPVLLDIARNAVIDNDLINVAGEPANILIGGVGGSGFAFNDDAALSAFIRESWGTATVDMESAAIAQVCWSNSMPCLQVRSVSDIVGNESPNEFAEFKNAAEGNAGRILMLILRSGALPRLD